MFVLKQTLKQMLKQIYFNTKKIDGIKGFLVLKISFLILFQHEIYYSNWRYSYPKK